MIRTKEWLYVGYYVDVGGHFILKIGTTNDLNRRKQEHNRHYKKAKENQMPQEGSFNYLWKRKLSKYNTLRYEDRNREAWKNAGIGEYIRNDRFRLDTVPASVTVTIRKTFVIPLVF